MELGRIRRIVAATAAALALALAATPAWSEEYDDPSTDASSPPMFDLFFLRPIGIVGIGIGAGLFVMPVAPLTLLTRPSDIGAPFQKLVVGPVRYVVADPLGQH